MDMSSRITTTIEVKGLRLQGRHGVFAQETRVGNVFNYDVEVTVPWLDAADCDEIGLTVSYADIVSVVREVNSQPSRLLEHVALRLRSALLVSWPQISAGCVRVAKIKPPIAATELDEVAVSISW